MSNAEIVLTLSVGVLYPVIGYTLRWVSSLEARQAATEAILARVEKVLERLEERL